MTLNTEIRPAITVIAATTLLLGVIFPLGFTGLAKVAAPFQANGSLVERDGHVVGSALIGQNFTQPRYFHSRPSATTGPDPKDPSKTVPAPDNAANSSASNLGPTSQALIDRIRTDLAGRKDVAPDAVTTSGSGLDPDISPANAAAQVARVAAARNLPPGRVADLVARNTRSPILGIFGEAHVNVLGLNMALDALQK